MAKHDDKTSTSGRLQEAAVWQSDKPIEVVTADDGETTILRDVLIVGRVSKNRVDYLDEALNAGCRLYESANAFVGHDRAEKGQTLKENLGVYRNPRVAADGIHADHAMPTADPLTPKLVWRAKHAPKNIGYSHDSSCSWHLDSKGRKQVYSIDTVHSVDVVMKPSHGKGMREEESELPAEQQPLAESVLSACDDLRSVMLSDGEAADKRGRLLEAVYALHGELVEGEISDEMAANKPMRDMREAADIASRKLDEARWSSDKYPQTHHKINRHMEVLKDHIKTLSTIKCNCPECGGKTNNLTEETSTMEFKDITAETLKANRPDLVALLTGTDEHSRLTEEVNTTKTKLEAAEAEVARLKGIEEGRLKEQEITAELTAAKIDVAAVSTAAATKGLFGRLREQLLAAPDKTARQAIINDYKPAFSGRLQEARMPGPMEELTDPAAKKQPAIPADASNKYFGK